ncbi:hypothetical protein XENORESO_002155 [Xenotaenia resolanae]|uniref:Uncharacterized protein n=1 Tax=Xenotaenia resolanae TaxID=208358 RepID=A0ABV0W8M6_9TELE
MIKKPDLIGLKQYSKVWKYWNKKLTSKEKRSPSESLFNISFPTFSASDAALQVRHATNNHTLYHVLQKYSGTFSHFLSGYILKLQCIFICFLKENAKPK